MAGHHSVHSHATEGGEESSSKSKLSHNEEDTTSEDKNAEVDKGGAETSSNGQVASDGEEGQVHPQTEDTLTGISQVFGTHEDTDPESNPGRRPSPSGKSSTQQAPRRTAHPKESSESFSEEEPPTGEALCNEAMQRARQLDTHFDAWYCKKIAKGLAGWATRDTMICDLPKHGKTQPNHPGESVRSLTVSDPTSMTCTDSTPWG